MIGTAVFAVTGVLAVNRRGLDVFGAMVLLGCPRKSADAAHRDALVADEPA
jgi:uncharacterized membrane protein YeiH